MHFLNYYKNSFTHPSLAKSIDYLNHRLSHSDTQLPFYLNVLSTRYKNQVVAYLLDQLYLLIHQMNYLCLVFNHRVLRILLWCSCIWMLSILVLLLCLYTLVVCRAIRICFDDILEILHFCLFHHGFPLNFRESSNHLQNFK